MASLFVQEICGVLKHVQKLSLNDQNVEVFCSLFEEFFQQTFVCSPYGIGSSLISVKILILRNGQKLVDVCEWVNL